MIGGVQEAARTKGVQLPILKAGSEDEFDAVFDSLAQLHAGALIVAADPLFGSRREKLVALAARPRRRGDRILADPPPIPCQQPKVGFGGKPCRRIAVPRVTGLGQ